VRVDGVQRIRVHAAGGRDCLLHFRRVRPELPGQLLHAGVPSQRLGQLRLCAEHAGSQVLDVAWRTDHPRAVAQVPLQLTGDGGGCIGRKAFTLGLVKAAGCLHQPQVGHLVQVCAFAAAGFEPPSKGLREVQVAQDKVVLEGLPQPARRGGRSIPVRKFWLLLADWRNIHGKCGKRVGHCRWYLRSGSESLRQDLAVGNHKPAYKTILPGYRLGMSAEIPTPPRSIFHAHRHYRSQWKCRNRTSPQPSGPAGQKARKPAADRDQPQAPRHLPRTLRGR
jgi:hypothetical protein